MIKATAGGGGRGIRIAENAQELLTLASQSSAEAKAAFGNGDLYLEKFIDHARHIEVQILGMVKTLFTVLNENVQYKDDVRRYGKKHHVVFYHQKFESHFANLP